jgi:hypothetical protein
MLPPFRPTFPAREVLHRKECAMKRALALVVLFVFVAASAVLADDMGHMDHAKMHAGMGAGALDPIKKLAGTWVGTAGSGDQKMDATVTYRVTANGSCVMETLFPGTDHEMVTMYTADKSGLVLTHYCAAGNQPRMKASKASDKEIDFAFAGGGNIDPAKDQHMHSAKMMFVDDDHLHTEWGDWNGGKASVTRVFELARQK